MSVSSMPATDDGLIAKLLIARDDYKNRAAREE
jgi:hypothetical protein